MNKTNAYMHIIQCTRYARQAAYASRKICNHFRMYVYAELIHVCDDFAFFVVVLFFLYSFHSSHQKRRNTTHSEKYKKKTTANNWGSLYVHDNDDYNDVGNKPIFPMFAFVSYLRDMHRKTFKCIRSHFFLLFPSLSSAPPLDTVPHIHYTLCDCCFFLSVSCLISRCLFVAIASVLGFCTDTHSI